MHRQTILAASVSALAVLSACTPKSKTPVPSPAPKIVEAKPAGKCAGLMSTSWTDTTMRIESAVATAAGPAPKPQMGAPDAGTLPAHCDVKGILRERIGQDGKHYAIRFHMRLPDDWNGKFLFLGGGGTDGDIGSAIGPGSAGASSALALGYAVVSGDSGHSNETNNDPAAGGMVSFGLDAQAREDYGHAALKRTYDAARDVLVHYYPSTPSHSYFVGCSKGGQEGLAFAERYPQAFDGILAGAPGMSLPRAALGHAWDAQAFASALPDSTGKKINVSRLPDSFSNSDFHLVQQAVLDACDALDGLKDGIVADFGQCTTKRVLPFLQKRVCKGKKTTSCIAERQIAALVKSLEGPHNSKHQALYSSFPWDAGIADPGWRVWKIGFSAASDGPGPKDAFPGIAVAMGAGSLSEIFSTPPKVLAADMQSKFDYLLAFNFVRDAPAIYATSEGFPNSAWNDVNARSADLSVFRSHNGKLIVYHGVSDPVFSINDTIAWWKEVNAKMNGHADDTVRLFAVPGMTHCGGGPATDQFDAFDALVKWVEKKQAPVSIEATASQGTPWPGRTRPLCAYPAFAHYTGKGATERAESFVCVRPGHATVSPQR